MRTVLVSGGAGFLGSHLVEELLEGGAVVRVVDNLSTGSLANLQAAADRHARGGTTLNGGRLEVIIGDIRDRELLRKALLGVKYVFHLAALPASGSTIADSVGIHAVNVEGTLNVLHGALTEGVWRVVLASCASVYGAPETMPVTEDAPLRPTSLFAASKVAAETYGRAFHACHHLDTVILRYFSVYGPRQKPGSGGPLVGNVIEAIRQRRGLVNRPELGTNDFINVDDAVAATVAAGRAPRAAGHAINVGSGQAASVEELMQVVGNALGTAFVPSAGSGRGVGSTQVTAGIARAAELLDFAPRVSLVEGVGRLVRVMAEAEQPRPDTLASVGLD